MKTNFTENNITKSLVFIPSDTSWSWTVDVVRQTAIELAKRNNFVICYLRADSFSWKDIFNFRKHIFMFKKYKKNIYLYNPFNFIPFGPQKFAEKINSFVNMFFIKVLFTIISTQKKFRKKFFWIFDPDMVSFISFVGNDFYVIYDCVDFLTLGNKSEVIATKNKEKLLCDLADLVVANSRVLLEHLKKYKKNVGLVPQGFRSQEFNIKKNKYINLGIKSPVIGFVGGLNNRLDTSILLSIVKNNPKWNFVLWGPIQESVKSGSDRISQLQKILKYPNVFSGESRDKEEIPGIISQFDIGMIPYDISQDFNKYCYPMKLFEYFYFGKPVISTDILELRNFPGLVTIKNTSQGWNAGIKKILSEKWSVKNIKQEKRLSKENSWEMKISKIGSYIKYFDKMPA